MAKRSFGYGYMVVTGIKYGSLIGGCRMENVIKEIKKFNDERDWNQYHAPAQLAKSICIESAELLECFQWDDVHFDKEHVCEELADVMIYCISMANRLDVDMETIILSKMEKNALKYPVAKAKGKSDKYDKL